MCRVDKSVFSMLLINLSELFTRMTGITVDPPEADHHGTNLEIEVNRINRWLLAANQALDERRPSSPMNKNRRLRRKEMVTNVDGNAVLRGSVEDDR